jgi:thiol-disulfide isomerase/thioredoxin
MNNMNFLKHIIPPHLLLRLRRIKGGWRDYHLKITPIKDISVKLFTLILLIVSVCLLIPQQAYSDNKIKIYFFWGDGCPHCKEELKFLNEMKEKYPQIEIDAYEVWFNIENARFLSQITNAIGMKNVAVPFTLIGNSALAGFHSPETTGKAIEEKIKECIEKGCEDPLKTALKPDIKSDKVIAVPGFGKIDSSKFSLPVFTIIIAGLDSFNPCAFFVLFMLLSLLVHARSKGRMFFIGGIFVFFSGFIYFVFMAAWLNFFMYAGQIRMITLISGIIALAVATINVKDFFFFKKGVSLSIPEEAKPKLFDRMRRLLKVTSLSSMFMGTAILAIIANTYELLCTVGFPMLYTRVLTLQNLPQMQYYLYLILYNTIYVIPLAVIVVIFSLTLGAKKLTEEQGRGLKLISGIMMLLLGIILLINPLLLNNMIISVAVLVTTLGLSAVIIYLTKALKKDNVMPL